MLDWALSTDVDSIQITYRGAGRQEETICTGLYLQRPAEAVRAALRASIALTQIEEVTRGAP